MATWQSIKLRTVLKIVIAVYSWFYDHYLEGLCILGTPAEVGRGLSAPLEAAAVNG